MTKFNTIILLLCTACSSAMAGTIVEIQSGNDLTTVMTDGKQARMSMSADEYVIANYQDNTMKYVSKAEREILLIDLNSKPAGKSAHSVKASIKKLGTGKTVAGYSTEKFSYSANDKKCGVVYGSKQALKLEGIEKLFKAMSAMAEKQRSMMGGYSAMIDECTQAEMNMDENIKTVGVPMRTEKDGHILSEVRSIKVNASLPADAFTAPADYKTVSMQQKMEEMSGKMADVKKQMQQQQPQMQEMMRQMQQSGQMTPEMMERMRQAEEMMKRYQQP